MQREAFREKLCTFKKVAWDSWEIDELMRLWDKYDTGFVTIFTLADLMRSFGNNVQLIKQAINCP